MKMSFLFGATAGAAAMYLLDPDNGRGRRQEAQRVAQNVTESPTAQKVADKVREQTRSLMDNGENPAAVVRGE